MKIIHDGFLKESIRSLSKILLILFSIFLPFCCTNNEQSLDERINTLELQTLPEVTHPANNPPSIEKIELGRLLFWDPILSGEKNISCAHPCHHPTLGYGDGIDLSIGPGGSGLGAARQAGTDRPLSASISMRNSITIVNSAFVGLRDANQIVDPLMAPLNWQINRRSLEAQAFGPIGNLLHMRGKGAYNAATAPDSIVKRLSKIREYISLFDRAFGGGSGSVTKENLGKAIAAFERSIVSKNSQFDKYVNGQPDALTDKQKHGLLLFYGKANCSNCHAGPLQSDFGLYNLGIKDHPLVTPKDKGSNGLRLFRTPSLRNIALTAPYMHNGTIPTLKDVVDFYDKAQSENDSVSRTQMSIKIQPLHLTENEKEALVSFLESLTDESYDKKIPPRVPSGLKVGGN